MLCIHFCFSPSGKLVQIEYALAAVAKGGPSVGVKGMNLIPEHWPLSLLLTIPWAKNILKVPLKATEDVNGIIYLTLFLRMGVR